MDWQIAANVATVAQGILVPISLLAVAYQMRRQTELTRAANTQSLVEMSSPFNLQLIQDRGVAKLWVKGAEEYDTMDPVTQYRYESLIIWWMLFHENIYYQHQKKLIDGPTYEAWDKDLRDFVPKRNLPKHWPQYKDVCQQGFLEYIETLIPADQREASSESQSQKVEPAGAKSGQALTV